LSVDAVDQQLLAPDGQALMSAAFAAMGASATPIGAIALATSRLEIAWQTVNGCEFCGDSCPQPSLLEFTLESCDFISIMLSPRAEAVLIGIPSPPVLASAVAGCTCLRMRTQSIVASESNPKPMADSVIGL
jgi:hypothetical protein